MSKKVQACIFKTRSKSQKSANGEGCALSDFLSCTSRHMAMIKREGKGQQREEVKCTRTRVRKYKKRAVRIQANGQFSNLLRQVERLKKVKKEKSSTFCYSFSLIISRQSSNTDGDTHTGTHTRAQYMLSLAVSCSPSVSLTLIFTFSFL